MSSIPLTRKQIRVLAFIQKRLLGNGMPPTRHEISKHFGWKSINAATEHLVLIERKGYIRLVPNIARGIVVCK